MKTPILETERLLLRPLTVADACSAYENWTSDADVARFMRWERHEDVAETHAWLETEEAMVDSDTVYSWGMVEKETGELIGSAGLVWNDEEGMYEPGYNVMKVRWGRGYATEAARRIVEYATGELGQKRLFCCHAKENPASGRVMENVGFRYRNEGVYYSRDGKKCFEAKEYLLIVE